MDNQVDLGGSEYYPEEGEFTPISYQTVGSEKTDVSPHDIYRLARNILISIAIIFILSMFMYCYKEAPGAVIFDVCKTVLPPIATLVIGYYFGEKSR